MKSGKKGRFKRGAGNIEFIISFILFVGFVAAAIYLFNPAKTVGTMENAKLYAFSQIAQNISIGLDSYSGKTTCSDNARIEISGTSGKNARVEDYSGNVVESGKSGNSVCFSNSESGKFLTVKFSEDFSDAGFSCGNAQTCFEISSSITNKVISEKRIRALNESYSDYARLKEQLNIPSNVDFGFIIEFLDSSRIEAMRGMPVKDVFSETRRIEVLRANGKSEFAYLSVRVW